MPVWWNWQTRWIQNPVIVISYRFDPDHRHQNGAKIIGFCSVFYKNAKQGADMFYTEEELEKAEVRIVNGRKVYSLPTKPCLKISEAVKYYLCALIPQGRLVIGDTLEKFVAKKLNIENIVFEEDLFDKAKNIDDVLKHDKTYKMISSVGGVYKIYVDKLSIEGFTFKSYTKYMVKVNDYKKYLFDFEKETEINAATIERIVKKGYASLKVFDR